MNIPINLETLLAGKVVETDRIEFKKSWNSTRIMRTVAAFANDFENLGSGYIIVGIEEENGMPKRPVYGFPIETFDKVQQEMIGYSNLIRPPYFPRLSLEEIDGKYVLLIWVTAGSNRPYEVPKDVNAKIKDYAYYIRQYSNTIQVNREQKLELLSLTANIPLDDRVNSNAVLGDISADLIQHHLKETASRLYDESTSSSHKDICRQMNLAEGADEYVLPKNVGLLMFNEQPEKFFPATQINLVEFPKGIAGDEFYEKNFTGPIQQQLLDALIYLKKQIITSKTTKIKGEAESITFYNYPFEAVEEALANAVYHKNYEIREPIEVRILPEAIEIVSYGGPDPSIRLDDLNKGIIRARRYRNRRIGEFLKELDLTEGKGTGIPTIKKSLNYNGSPPAKFDTDGNERRFFITEIPIHSEFAAQDRAQDKVLTDNQKEVGAYDSVYDNVYDRDSDKSNANSQLINRIITTLEYCIKPKTRLEVLEKIGLSNHSKNYKENIEPAINAGLLMMTLPDKPKSKHQKYITTDKGKKIIGNG